MADPLTVNTLHRIQDQRTAPGNGWMDKLAIARAMGIHDNEAFHLNGTLKELNEAGMIEHRWNAAATRDEWRSIGVRPAHPADHREAAADPTQINEPLGATAREVFIYLYRHGGFVVDADLMHALGIPTLGLLWAAMAQLEAAGLTQRRLNNGRAVRLHTDVRDMLA